MLTYKGFFTSKSTSCNRWKYYYYKRYGLQGVFYRSRRKLKFDCDEGWFSGIKKTIKSEDYTFFWKCSVIYINIL